jgi:hypothetical protein
MRGIFSVHWNLAAVLAFAAAVAASAEPQPAAPDEEMANRLLRKYCADPINFSLSERLRLLHYDENVVRATKDCANAAAEAKVSGINLLFKGLDKLTPQASAKLEACLDRHRELDPVLRGAARDLIKDAVEHRDAALDKMRATYSRCWVNVSEGILKCGTYPCKQTPTRSAAARKLCEVDAEAVDRPWKRSAPRCAAYSTHVASEEEDADYRDVPAFRRCDSFLIHRCR